MNKQPSAAPVNLFKHRQNTVFSVFNGRPISCNELLNHALQISQQLPEKTHAINLCRNRYLFTVAFLAVTIRNQINLLPANQSKNTISGLLTGQPQSYCIADNEIDYSEEFFFIEPLPPCGEVAAENFPVVNPEQVVSVSFTSGSTGNAKAIAKTWGELQCSAGLATQQLKIHRQPLTVVSTVPPQHMYGLETSLFWPMFSELTCTGGQPFFPEDIRQVVAAAATPCLLISTPAHLKVCASAGLSWKNIHMIISSTATLPADLATRIENSFNAPVFEIFGSTETLSYATRRCTKSQRWSPYQGIQLTRKHDRFELNGGHLQQTMTLDDRFEIDKDGRFTVLGRSADLLKIAGKRASLSELNSIINSIDGIEDAVFYETARDRVGAVVVSHLNKQHIFNELQQYLDPVFLPRPLHYAQQLPRNEVGKISKSGLQQLIEELESDKINQ